VTDVREVRDGVLTVSTVPTAAGCSVVLKGELDLANAETVAEEVRTALAEQGSVVVDLSALEFIDSTGIALLITVLRSEDGEKLRFVPSRSPAVRRVLRVTGVSEQLPYLDGDAPAR
jgi:anti-sigma B factor antagonist